eukprot:3337745-Prymnesium_polylepis.1
MAGDGWGRLGTAGKGWGYRGRRGTCRDRDYTAQVKPGKHPHQNTQNIYGYMATTCAGHTGHGPKTS